TREVYEVVEVAADLARRPVVRRELPARQLRKSAREEALLDELRDLKLLLDPLQGPDLNRLFPNQLANAEGGGCLGGEALEQPQIVAGVVLLAETRPEVQDPDQLALADERDGELHPGLAELAKRRGVELERVDVDGTGRRLEMFDEWVSRGDLDRL